MSEEKCKHEWRQYFDWSTHNCLESEGYYCIHCLERKRGGN